MNANVGLICGLAIGCGLVSYVLLGWYERRKR